MIQGNEQYIYFTDAHTHLQDYKDEMQMQLIMKESIEAGIKYVVINSNNMNFLPNSLVYGEYAENIIPCIGLHPWFIPELIDPIEYFEPMIQILKTNPNVQVGEIGLDFLKAKEKSSRDIQIALFNRQLEIASEYQRIMSVHCVHAHGEMLKVFKKFIQTNKSYNRAIVMHSYGGSKDIMKSLNKLYPNFYYSFSMNVVNRPDILDSVDLDKLLLETDAPHQFCDKALQKSYEYKQFREQIASEPRFLIDLLQKLSDHLQLPYPQLKRKIFNNFLRAFNKIN